jgi:SAM-dependent methyltransferase
MRLDIACGASKQEGWTGIDLADCPGVDIRHDLFSLPWPITSGVVTEAHCSHFFEHVPAMTRPGFMSEVWRVLMPGGVARLITPLGLFRQFRDFTHTWPVVPESYLYFSRAWLRAVNLAHYIDLFGITCNFEILDSQVLVADDLQHLPADEQTRRIYAEMNAGVDLVTTLRKIPLEA